MADLEPNVDAAQLAPRGQPLHTRTLVVDVMRHDPETLRAEGQILDVRKCGFVPGAGDLQTAGFIHLMKIGLGLDREDLRIRRLEVDQPTVAYEPDAETTGGECCRDPAPRLQALVGERLDDRFAARLREVFGGPLGCSHLLTLAQLMGSSLPPGLEQDQAIAPKGLSERRDGERLFKRTLILDGLAAGPGHMEVTAQLSAFHMRPRERVDMPLERLARLHEVHVDARIGLEEMQLVALDAAERVRSWASFGDESWTSRADAVAPFVGGPALRGLSRAVLERLGGRPEHELLTDVLLNLGPCLIQCLAATSMEWMARAARGPKDPAPESARSGPDMQSMGGFPDSCYVWRRDGAMGRRRFGGDG